METADVRCKVCRSRSEAFESATILGKYQIEYFRCGTCGLIETEKPYWLAESYAEPIAQTDIGLVERNVDFARRTAPILQLLFRGARKFVDYGGGYGLFVRMMRDRGYNFYRYDKYCSNLFANGFDAHIEADESQFDLLTAFEVFEHLVDPLAEVARMLALSRNILFSTCLIPREAPPRPKEWWYYALQTGQHVTLYTVESLKRLAEENNLYFHSAGSLHLLTEQSIPNWKFRMVCGARFQRLVRLIPNRPSLLADDFRRLTGQSLT